VWLNALDLSSISNWNKICSEHFSANGFIFSNGCNILQSTAVPTKDRDIPPDRDILNDKTKPIL